MDSHCLRSSFENQARMNPAPKPSIEDTLEKLQELWTVMGFNEEEKKERVDIFNNYLSHVLNELYQEEEDQFKMLKNIIVESQKEVEELCWQLGMPSEELTLHDQDLPALQMKKQLSSQLNSLKKEKNSREKALSALRETEKELCLLLDMSPLQLSTCTGVPTKQDLVELEQQVKMLEVERDHRMREYYSSKRELTTIMEETEYLPDTSFGANLLFGEDNVILSQQNIKELKDLVEKAYHKKCELERELQSLKDRLQTLWERLNIEEHERTTFLSTYSGCKMSVINAFEREIEKCEDLKKKNIGKYIAKMRNELTQLWDKCYYSQDEREKFEYFCNDDFTEALLDIHDAEVQRLKEYYKENERIFSLISRRNQLWDNMILFEKKASDPNRFNNRGGQLLQEEKERNRLLKELPRLESEIFDLILQYEETSGNKFLVNGKDFEKVVEEQRKQHIEEREKEKLERRQRASSSAKPLANCSNMTPAKRQPNTPLRTPSKFRRLNPGMSTLRVPGSAGRAGLSLTPAAGSKNRSRMLRQSPRTVPQRKNATSGEQMMGNENEAPESKGKDNAGKLIESISTYSQFTRELNKSKRNNCRSSSKYLLRSTSCSHERKLTPFHGKLGLPFLI